jgi:hypothetical protein
MFGWLAGPKFCLQNWIVNLDRKDASKKWVVNMDQQIDRKVGP